MVFEQVVVDVLNRFLGEYVQNLDASQLKLGIWGGDVVLRNLALKDTALSDLNLPVRVAWGQLGKLVLKIPWKNLYSAPVIVNVEDLFILISPDNEVVYNAEKEERWAKERKEAQLRRVEEAKKLAAEKDKVKTDDTFVEKLVTQIVKNVQVEIKHIHIRYEDKTTNLGAPFAAGATISSLVLQTTDENLKPCFITQDVAFIFKVLKLEGLSIYWNSCSDLVGNSSFDFPEYFRSNIPHGNFHPKGYNYLFGPIFSSAKLILNPKPETDGTNFSRPKVELDINMNELAVALTKKQFQDMMLLVENLDLVSRGLPFRKLRPNYKTYRGHYAAWWKFAYTCVLVDIKRRKRDWDWLHIQRHRNNCREYQRNYAKILVPKPPADALQRVKELEAELDVFNLVLLRERAAMDAQRLQQEEEAARANRGWFSGWFGSAQPITENERFSVDIAKKIEGVMTPEEKSKLYQAIGYQENTAPMNYPPTFVENRITFLLKTTSVKVIDDGESHRPLIVNATLQNLKTELEQRPSASAIRANFSIAEFTVDGVKQVTGVPQIVRSNCKGNENLIDILFETNPIDDLCDIRVYVAARPLRIIYNHETVKNLQDIFASSSSSAKIGEIKAKASSSVPSFRHVSSIGLQYAVENRTRLDVKVNVSASTILIPHEGVYLPNRAMIVINLGELVVETEDQNSHNDSTVKKLYHEGLTEEEIFSSFVSESYTKFNCQLKGAQILMRLSNEDWEKAIEKTTTPLHLLQPTNLLVVIKKSLVTDDARIPKIVVEGTLPSIAVNITEERLLAVAALAFSMPSDPLQPQESQSRSSSTWSLSSMSSHLGSINRNIPTFKDQRSEIITEVVQGIDLICKFEMNEFVVNVKKPGSRPHDDEKFLTLSALKLRVEAVKKTFDTNLKVALNDVDINQRFGNEDIQVVSTGGTRDISDLFALDVVLCEKTSPEFYTTKGAVLTFVTLRLSQSKIVLHQGAILELMDFANNITTKVDKVKKTDTLVVAPVIETQLKRKLSQILEEGPKKRPATVGKRKRDTKRIEVIDLKAVISLEQIAIVVRAKKPLTVVAVDGITVSMSSRKSYSTYDVLLRSLTVKDLNPNTIYSTIVMSQGKETIHITATMYNRELIGTSDSVDMSIEARLGQIRLVYLYRFLSELLDFSSSFQTAVTAVKEASSAAAERAKQNMIKAYEDASRLSLDIKLQAPLVLAPLNSGSCDALVVDLGVLTIRNSFTTLKKTDEGSPVIDTMRLLLQELKLTRATVDKKTLGVIYEYPLLDPVTFELTVQRNLSAAWFKEVPDLEISSRLGTIRVSLDQQDYSFILNVLRENHGEVGEGFQKSDAAKTETLEYAEREATAEDTPSVHTAVMFSFSMQSFVISLYPGGTKKVSEKHHLKPRSEYGLANFVLETLAVKGKLFSNGSICASVRLLNCLMDDTRREKKEISRLMERKKIPNDDNASMIDVTYEKKEASQFMDVRVRTFNLVLSMEYLMKVAAFFTPDAAASQTISQVRARRRGRKVVTNAAVQQQQEEVEPSSDSNLTFIIQLEKPDIILVENMDDINTDALVFHVELYMKYRTDWPRQVISGTLSDIQLYSCCLNPDLRKSTMKQIIKPVTISLAGSTPEGKGLHLDLNSTAISLSINPRAVRLINQCLTAITSRQDALAEHKEEEDWSGLWAVKKFKESDYWFFMPDEAVEALEMMNIINLSPRSSNNELCMISFPSILLTFEAAFGQKTIPMIYMEMSFEGQAKNWSSGLNVEASMKFGMQYFNSSLSAWEPIIEPIAMRTNNSVIFIPWQLTFEVAMDKPDSDLPDDFTPGMAINVTSNDKLEITVTKSCLDVLNLLGETFGNAVSSTPHTEMDGDPPNYLVRNDTGFGASLHLLDSDLEVDNAPENITVIHGEEISLRVNKSMTVVSSRISYASPTSPTSSGRNFQSNLVLNFPDLKNEPLKVPLDRSVKRFYPITGSKQTENWGIVADVKLTEVTTTITLRSVVQLFNRLSVSVDVHYMTNKDNEVELIETVDPDATLNVPLNAVYSKTHELFFSVKGHTISKHPFVWKMLQNEMNYSRRLQCDSKTREDKDPFFINAVGEVEQACFQNTGRHNIASMCYNIYLQPTVELFNSLPTALTLAAQGSLSEVSIEPGRKVQIPQAHPGVSTITLRMANYLDKEWSCRYEIPMAPPEFSVLSFEAFDSVKAAAINLGVHCVITRGTITLTIYCPFWMINKTDCFLSYKFDDSTPIIYHPTSYQEPMMFSPSLKKFFGKRRGSIKIQQCEWSDRFSLDVAGSGGLIECKSSDGKLMKISVNIELTSNNLTKQLIFVPAYVIVNNTGKAIDCRESNVNPLSWLKIEPDACSPLWPVKQKESKLVLRVRGSDEESAPFPYHSTYSCLVKLKNQFGGVFVDIQCTAGGNYIYLHPYQPGLAPVLVINSTTNLIEFKEKNKNDGKWVLSPGECCFHAWESPGGTQQLAWKDAANKEVSCSLTEDDKGNYLPTKRTSVYYVSFLDGLQRTLLFTEDMRVADTVDPEGVLEKIDTKISLSISGIGLSIVNNFTQTELLYIGLVSSGVVWEARKHGGKRFKPINMEDSSFIETAYNRYQENESSGRPTDALVVFKNKLQVNLETLEITSPNKRYLRRRFEPGLFCVLQVSPHTMAIHFKINRLQIDNQLLDAIFPVILAPVPPPKTVAADHGPKPFFELSLLKRITSHSSLQQYKYFKILVQEFHIKLDLGFVGAISDFFVSESESSDFLVRQRFLSDVMVAKQPLISRVQAISSQDQKNFYDILHFSPIKIHLSFSLDNVENKNLPPAIGVLLQSVGVTLTQIDDAIFRLSYFERKNAFLTRTQIRSEALSHYVGQALRQAYVIVLGLDVIGNPYGLITGIGEGVEALFYEPFQGIIQGPSEFAEGLGLGVKSLFGHTVGGTAGAFSRITGTLGKGLAVLSLDKEYQQQRLAQQNRTNDSIQATFAQGGKGVVMGVFHGVAGVVTKPISGAQEEGVGGFFKGVGKGVMGLVTRPVSGVVDFASTSLNAIKKATEQGEGVNRIRNPRFLREGPLTPYDAHDATGNKLLHDIENRRYASTDIYHYHIELPQGDVLILTDERLIIASMSDVFGTWQVLHSYTWNELPQPPADNPKGIVVYITKKTGLFASSKESKLIPIPNTDSRSMVRLRMESLYNEKKDRR